MLWCSGYHYCTILFNKGCIQVLHGFKSYLWHIKDSGCWGSLAMVSAGKKAKCFLWDNHTTKTIHLHHVWLINDLSLIISRLSFSYKDISYSKIPVFKYYWWYISNRLCLFIIKPFQILIHIYIYIYIYIYMYI